MSDKEVLRVELSSQYFEGFHDYEASTHSAKRDSAGCLLIVHTSGRVVRVYSPVAWLDVARKVYTVDSTEPYQLPTQ